MRDVKIENMNSFSFSDIGHKKAIARYFLSTVLLTSFLAFAGESNPVALAEARARALERQFELYDKALTLTEDQKHKVKALLEDRSKQGQELFQEWQNRTGVSKESFDKARTRSLSLSEEYDKKLRNILTPEQYAKYQLLPEVRRAAVANRRTAVQYLTDQASLAKIAMEDENLSVRRSAAGKLTDQALLAKIVRDGQDPGVRGIAAEKLTDQALLARMAVEEKDPVVRGAAAGKLTDQAALVKIATKDENSSVRRSAVGQLTDQALLAKIAAEEKDPAGRRTAAEKITDQALLAKIDDPALLAMIAGVGKDPSVRRTAVEKLTDQALLAKIAVEDISTGVRRTAVEKLTDQALLAKTAMNGGYSDVRLAAVGKLFDQTVLENIAMEGHYPDVCLAAVGKLTKQTVLAKVAANAKSLDARVSSIGRVTNQSLLRHWAEEDPQAVIRQAAAAQITDDKFLEQRLRAEPSAAVRTAIVGTLRGKDSLRGVAVSAYHQKDRAQALQRLQKDFSIEGSEAAKAQEALRRRVEALSKETDNAKLLAVAVDGEFDVLRAAAAKCMADPLTLEHTAARASDHEVLKILLAKLKDNAALNRIMAGAHDRAMRQAAAQKAGTKSWKEIFDAATVKGATVQMLGDALAAVSLYSETQPGAKEGVQHACLNLIRRGNESRIPEMVDLLEGYGDKALAEDYLNCGQPDLDTAARQWASRRGYNINTGAGSHRASWGNDR